MPLYHARVRSTDNTPQPIESHLQRVAKLSSDAARPIHLSATARLIGLFHDLGKITPDFQTHLLWSTQHPLSQAQSKVDHSTAGGQFILSKSDGSNEFSLISTEIIAHTIYAHHTGSLDLYDIKGESVFLSRSGKENILDRVDIDYFFSNIISHADFIHLLSESEKEIERLDSLIGKTTSCNDGESNEKYYYYFGLIQKLLLGILVDSDRRDSAEFELQNNIAHEYNPSTLFLGLSERLESAIRSFDSPTTPLSKINFLRQQISEDCLSSANSPTGIYQLSVPTGGGKTLASMRFALNHAITHNKKRIIIVIPYTSIIDQTAEVLRGVFGDGVVYEHHSDIIPPSEEYKNITSRWDAPIIVTTQVQFLNTIFDGRNTSLRRLQALVDSVIVFDEIQTIPIRCTHLFNSAVNFLAHICNTTTLLCTATQPPLERLGCPVELSPNPQIARNSADVFESFRRVRVERISQEVGISLDNLAREIVRGCNELGNVLCIVNLTKQARELYCFVSDLVSSSSNTKVLHLSTKMCPAHRKSVLAQLTSSRHQNERIICIATQLVECGVDISFPLVYRALSGLPSITQAAGRCNRNGEIDCGVVRLFELENENLLMLPEISQGKGLVKEILHTLDDPNTLLDQSTMHTYFDRYYNNISQKTLRYPLKSANGTIYDLLAANNLGVGAREERGESVDLFFPQAFKTAGKEFSVIDSNTQSVLVPYGDGEKLIALFDKVQEKKKIYKNLQKAQRYCVNLFENEVAKLKKKNTVYETKSGVLALKKEFYDRNTGVVC